ncbi:methylated-DNA--[protein]-cysteine S-methyltransferase [Marinibacterium profundimaris]|uniref:Cysteine methyltransferase n=1 Tax=Marinibacterium profundimaris TaxID=1679460 RepID=A0A225NFX6_9RHOB|nr:methylated-DNA--[protein]-cysteine S-methyltransferase [Marinibacterium profundimaris]OWU72465.1 cysteine methyltransferase [Marinibacterium profundimaris]
MATVVVPTRFGEIALTQDGDALVRATWDGETEGEETPLLAEAARQLGEYDAGTREDFDLPMEVRGSEALQAVCAAMRAIPFGYTRTYGEIAKDTGLSAQAVGQLCGSNPLAILIPCHRVMGASGLTGYSGKGGVETKVALLRHEGAGSFLI